MSFRLPSIALVGRPNVGKSRLFNRLARRRLAIVHDQPGVTRDVQATEVENHYTLLDTGGIGLVPEMSLKEIVAAAEEQVWFALEAADVIGFVVDVRDGLTPLDMQISERLRASGRPLVLIVNKVDSERLEDRISEFDTLGFERVVPVSAEHGRNESVLREVFEELVGPPPEVPPDAPLERVKIAFAGKPNVGKSSLCNALLKEERLVVSEVPGTTRDSIALNLDYHTSDDQILPFQLVDTAGLRKRGSVDTSVEFFSSVRTRGVIERADIVFLVIDALGGVTRFDKTIAGEVMEAGKCLGIIVNKWDLAVERWKEAPVSGFETIDDFRKEFARAAREQLFFTPESPVIFTSALTGYAIERILRAARRLRELSGRQLPTPQVNRLVERLMTERTPKIVKGARFKVYYAVQTGIRPFRFRLFCNRATKLDDSYRRYLQSAFIKEFGLDGCPLRFELRGKEVRYANKGKTRS